MNETINAGKPIVATPFRADQPMNAKVAVRIGLAVQVNTRKLTAKSLAQAVQKVLDNPSYKKCAEDLRKKLLRSGGAEKCAETVENFAGGYDEILSKPPTVGTRLKESRSTLVLLALSFAAGALLSERIARSIRTARKTIL